MTARERPLAIVVQPAARRDLLALPPRFRDQLRRTVDRLIETLRAGQVPQDMRKLRGMEDAYRIDSGEYRVLFTLTPARVVILQIEGEEQGLTPEQAAAHLGVSPDKLHRLLNATRLRGEVGRVLTIARVRHRRDAYRNL
jgi:mRNA-degrading endonuclease RelE of RelBE toxin-antitoxin system